MKTIALSALVLIAAAGLAMPARAQMGGMGGMGGGGTMGGMGAGSMGGIGAHGPGTLPPQRSSGSHDPEGDAEELRLAGHCNRAVPILRSLVESPKGFPISQYNLGLCLLDLAAADHDAAQAARQRQEGAAWIVRAANGGFGKAQAKAVALYLDGIGIAADPVEAEKWALIFHRNGLRLALGLPDISSDLRDRLDALSDAQQDAAQARADAWAPPPVDQ